MEEKNDLKGQVMNGIRERRVKMRCSSFFLIEKLVLTVALIALLIFSALIIDIIYNIIDKTEILKFFNLGFPGLRVIILTLPYDYMALLLITLGAAIYFARRLDIPCRENISCNRIFLYFFVASFLVGIFFILLGLNEAMKKWSKGYISSRISVHGRIVEISPQKVVIEEGEGELTTLVFDKEELSPDRKKYSSEKFLRAVGSRDKNNQAVFHVQSVLCCEDN